MAEGQQAQQDQPAATAPANVKDEETAAARSKDVLEEDDDFEEFEDDAWDDNVAAVDENLEWEDNWDDEVEGEDDFSKRLRAELAVAEQEQES